MGILVVGNEKNFRDLRPRLFTGRVPAAALQRANAALAGANPHVDLGALQPGTVLTIPDVPEILDRGPLLLDASVQDRIAAVADELTSSLAAMRDEAKGQVRQARAEHKQTLAAFDDDLVRRAASGNPDLAAALDAARAAIEQDDADAAARLKGLSQSVDGWTAEIETLRKLAG
jgi:hypothetical protein